VATHKSSEKRARSAERKNFFNRRNLSAVKTAIKKFREAAQDVVNNVAKDIDKEALHKLFSEAQARLAKAGARGIIHRNAAARKIGRLADTLKYVSERLQSGSKAPEVKKTKTAKKSAPKKAAAAKAKAKTKKN